MRVPSLLFLCSLASAAMAQSADVRAGLTMPATVVCHVFPQDPASGAVYAYAQADGTLTLFNAGSVAAKNVIFDLTGMQLSDASAYPQVTCTFVTTGRCTLQALAPGSPLSMPVTGFWPNLAAAGTVETMSVTLSNNTVSANTTIVFQSDATFDALSVPSPIAPGKSAAIDAYYSNHGPSPASDLSITISIPPGATYLGYQASSWLHCTEPPLGGHGDLVCKAANVGTISNDAVRAVVGVEPSLAPGTVLSLKGTLTSTSALQSPQKASGSLTVIAPNPADAVVGVAAAVDGPAVLAGGMTTERYTVSNAGPAGAKGVTLDVTLPAGIVPAATASTFDSCSGTAPVHCTAATLAAGATMTLTVPVQTSAIGTFTSTAVVTWLNGGIAATSADLAVTPSHRRAAHH